MLSAREAELVSVHEIADAGVFALQPVAEACRRAWAQKEGGPPQGNHIQVLDGRRQREHVRILMGSGLQKS